MTRFLRQPLWPAFALLVALTLITGVVYPAVVTAVAQVAFPAQANGSMIVVDGQDRRLEPHRPGLRRPEVLLGPPLGRRRSDGYDASASAGSNLGPTNQELIDRVTADVDRLRAANGGGPVPVDLVTTSPRAWTRTSARPAPTTRSPASRRRAACPRTMSGRRSPGIPNSRCSASSASPG